MVNIEAWVDLLVGKVSSWLDSIVLALPNFLLAVIVVLVSYYFARWVQKAVVRWSKHVSENKALNKLFSKIVYLLVLAAGTFFALGVLNLDKTVTSLLAGLGILGLALGFAFQDIAANFISGIIVVIQKPIVAGDLIETNGITGRVEHISIRTTEITTPDGLTVVIPNKDVLGNPLTNYTKTDDRRVDLRVGVSYADDLEKAKKLTLKTVKTVKGINKDKPIDFFYEEFGDSSINFVVRFWLSTAAQRNFLEARSEAIIKIKKAFDKEGISIPFPIRTLDFGIGGGVSLSEMLK